MILWMMTIAKFGVGLGCNGIIHILIEPILDLPGNPISLLQKIIANRGDAVLVTLFSIEDRKAPQPGTILCLTKNSLDFTKKGISFRDDLINAAGHVLKQRKSENKIYHDTVEFTAFVEHIKPLISLVIVGAGNDALPLNKIAAVLGWDIIVIDGRNNYAVAERFPWANRVIVSKPENVLSHLNINEWTALVLMTHNYNYEIALLKNLLPLSLPYIGVLGPKKKLERMLAEIEDSDQSITDEQLNSVFGPVGLDIGSESPEEIALSIVAEVKAILSSREGCSLKYKPVSIHSEK